MARLIKAAPAAEITPGQLAAHGVAGEAKHGCCIVAEQRVAELLGAENLSKPRGVARFVRTSSRDWVGYRRLTQTPRCAPSAFRQLSHL
jgi:hypothetical protein